jgi:hypothetical protein
MNPTILIIEAKLQLRTASSKNSPEPAGASRGRTALIFDDIKAARRKLSNTAQYSRSSPSAADDYALAADFCRLLSRLSLDHLSCIGDGRHQRLPASENA